MVKSLVFFVLLFTFSAADVSHVSKKYLPPAEKTQIETSNKYLPPKSTENVMQNDEKIAEDEPQIKEDAVEQAQPKQSSALTETQVTTTTFIPCTSINGAPCIPNNGFYQGGPGSQFPGGLPGQFPLGGGGQFPGGFPGQYPVGGGAQFPGSLPGQYPSFYPGYGPGNNFPPAPNYYPYGGQNFVNGPGQFGPNYPGSFGPQVFPESFPGSQPGQNFAAGQNFEAGSNFVVGQNNLPRPGPVPAPFPGQNFFPRPPFAGNGFGFPMGGFFTDNGDGVAPVEELIPESLVRTTMDTQYADDGGYLYKKPLIAALLR